MILLCHCANSNLWIYIMAAGYIFIDNTCKIHPSGSRDYLWWDANGWVCGFSWGYTLDIPASHVLHVSWWLHITEFWGSPVSLRATALKYIKQVWDVGSCPCSGNVKILTVRCTGVNSVSYTMDASQRGWTHLSFAFSLGTERIEHVIMVIWLCRRGVEKWSETVMLFFPSEQDPL